jgi:hypothetical protein
LDQFGNRRGKEPRRHFRYDHHEFSQYSAIAGSLLNPAPQLRVQSSPMQEIPDLKQARRSYPLSKEMVARM